MKEKVKKYVDDLFSDIYETKQLNELKEEVSANLLEKINDFIARGVNADEAFKKAVSNLGDMSELVESLKKASSEKVKEEMSMNDLNLDKKHVLGYVIASGIMLFGIMTAGIVYLQHKNLIATLGSLMPFLLIAAPIFIYFGLTQESSYEYGMSSKRALAYAAASEILLFGLITTGIVYFNGNQLYEVLATFMPFVIPSAVIYIYLGLTEKSRLKKGLGMNEEWKKQWVEYYSNPEAMMVRGNVSGALWIFSFAAFFLVGFGLGWKYSWIVFVIAVGCEVLIEAIFAARRKK